MTAIASLGMSVSRNVVLDGQPTTPFATVDQAWFWTMAALKTRRDGGRSKGSSVKRPCGPDDIIKCLDTLYRRRRIDMVHARILRIWGERGHAPSATRPNDRRDLATWREALDRLDWLLKKKGIVTV